MTRVTTPEAVAEVLSKPLPWAYAVGALPDAPPEVVIWLRPLTCAEARTAYNEAILRHRADWLPEYGRAALIAEAICVDPEALLMPPDGPPTCDPDRLQPVFDVAAAEALGVRAAVALHNAILQATGWFDVTPQEAAPFDLEAYRAAARYPGRWLSGWHPGEPQAALWVRGCTEGELQQAIESGRTTIGHTNPVAYNPSMLSHVLRTGPGGPPLMTATEALQLPYGASEALYSAAAGMALGGGQVEVRFRPEAERRGGDDANGLDRGASAPATDGVDLRAVGG